MKVAALQMVSGVALQANLEAARRLLEQAANDPLLASAPRRKAWLALAALAQQEGDEPRTARCFESAARLV